MNEKEIAEIRRRFRPDQNSITHIRGCYVNENREIVSQFNQSLTLMSQEECELILTLLRRTLSGAPDKNLINISFDTRQVVDGAEHKRLMALRDSGLEDTAAADAFFQQVVQSVSLEGNYLILLARDAYDVPYRAKDGAEQEDSSEVFSFLLCSICPVKLTKPALSYYTYESAFHGLKPDWVVSPPELGFLFPAFDDRSANIYGALYYTKSTGENHPEFVDAVFRQPLPMPAEAQKETFQALLQNSLKDECCYDVVQSVQARLCGLIQEHRERKEPEPLSLSKGAVREVLSDCGVSDAHVDAFADQYDEAFGPGAGLSPGNVVDTKQVEVRTPDVTIRVNPDRGDLVETRVINGARYILIRAEEGVEVNGVQVQIH